MLQHWFFKTFFCNFNFSLTAFDKNFFRLWTVAPWLCLNRDNGVPGKIGDVIGEDVEDVVDVVEQQYDFGID